MKAEIESRQYVSRTNMEELLFDLGTLPGEGSRGFFGPDSVTWRVNRESAVFLVPGERRCCN
jgi:uncharacterized protein (DUF2236 family)